MQTAHWHLFPYPPTHPPPWALTKGLPPECPLQVWLEPQPGPWPSCPLPLPHPGQPRDSRTQNKSQPPFGVNAPTHTLSPSPTPLLLRCGNESSCASWAGSRRGLGGVRVDLLAHGLPGQSCTTPVPFLRDCCCLAGTLEPLLCLRRETWAPQVLHSLRKY